MKSYVGRRVADVLDGREDRKEFATMTAAERKAVREILTETRPGLLAKSTVQ